MSEQLGRNSALPLGWEPDYLATCLLTAPLTAAAHAPSLPRRRPLPLAAQL